MKKIIFFISILFLVSGCGAMHHKSVVGNQATDENLTVGKVQRKIKPGMSSSQVAEALGSPNIVSTDEKGREVWIYDKISTSNVYSKSSSYGTILILGGQSKSGASTTTQRTLTIIVKYDGHSKVRDVAYHSSRF
ncbi:outer membrane protein assembly factor BamE [Desulfohalobium retbaense]|uniref:Type IV secretion system putative lipoprotein virB7 n=1 Tax=Desulfohalobium retbaense (strain ATCC 49708 / DSM 5692 / JCM 16813 / HR100) TaxID=485915 RepID=C8X1E8_DESRD|nr:outer membrane protein assembly factor BamE [Desulfohalobium retbaense]ACV68245.1 conserved hypothetical protein [Desulfohalobium retbaense DSM 5692]